MPNSTLRYGAFVIALEKLSVDIYKAQMKIATICYTKYIYFMYLYTYGDFVSEFHSYRTMHTVSHTDTAACHIISIDHKISSDSFQRVYVCMCQMNVSFFFFNF